MSTLDTLYDNREKEDSSNDYIRGYMHALRDLEHIVDNSEHLGDSELLEVLYEAIVDKEIL